MNEFKQYDSCMSLRDSQRRIELTALSHCSLSEFMFGTDLSGFRCACVCIVQHEYNGQLSFVQLVAPYSTSCMDDS